MAEANPAAYLPDFAMSLNSVSNRLGELGRREDGLDAVTEAVEMYRRLAEANHPAFASGYLDRLDDLDQTDQANEIRKATNRMTGGGEEA